LLTLMQKVYDEFVSRVAEGRGLSISAVGAVASGRVWTGAQALERKLVDELGGLDSAIRKAEELAEIPDGESTLRYYPKAEGLFDFLSKRLSTGVQHSRVSVLLSRDERNVLQAADYLRSFYQRREFVQLLAPIDTDF